MSISVRQLQQLKTAARRAAHSAYAPYSMFAVGAAILTGNGKIHAGCNVENAAYGLCNCAERTAIFNAVASGEKPLRLRCVVVFTPTPKPTAPCGACRQVMHEFGPDARVLSFCRGRDVIDTNMRELLPEAFGPAALV